MKKHPGWKNAFEIIVNRFHREGYGILFSEKELIEIMDIEEPISISDVKRYDLEKLSQLSRLKDNLLKEMSLCFENKPGDGYMIIHPNDQVDSIAKKYYRQSRKKINRVIKILTYVDSESLDMKGQQRQLEMLGRVAFIRGAMNKRKIIEKQKVLAKQSLA